MAGYTTPQWANGAAPAIDDAALTAMGQAIEIAEHAVGTCNTAADVANKEVTIDVSGTLTLFDGMRIRVIFTYGNTATGIIKLNVNNTGAKLLTYAGGGSMGGATFGAGTEFFIEYYSGGGGGWRILGAPVDLYSARFGWLTDGTTTTSGFRTNGGYVMMGRLVIVNMEITVYPNDITVAANTVLVSGLPRSSYGSSVAPTYVHDENTELIQTPNDGVVFRYTASGTLAKWAELKVFAVYFAEY